MAINWQVNNKEKGLMKIPNKSKNKMKMNNPVNNQKMNKMKMTVIATFDPYSKKSLLIHYHFDKIQNFLTKKGKFI